MLDLFFNDHFQIAFSILDIGETKSKGLEEIFGCKSKHLN